ncbi:MAG TPA: glycosyltransferase family 2 protein [Alphaproteobacteria bacterium]|nr:hypothetical protein [Rhodospirillaceae bacterium]HRJ12667.1 glycosyltransferase family 2 protein [Alphaproteobacteria bacterium]
MKPDNPQPLFTVGIPAYNASGTIKKTIQSILGPARKFSVEIVVVDDGSKDSAELQAILKNFDQNLIKLVMLPENRGLANARNVAIENASGEYFTPLDSDDEFVADWPVVFEKILAEWQKDYAHCEICFTQCLDGQGKSTVTCPEYKGLMTLDDFLNQRYSGEYLPIFHTAFAKVHQYYDLGTKKSCGIISYTNFAKLTQYFVTPDVLRIYHYGTPGSISVGWTQAHKARESAQCMEAHLSMHGGLLKEKAPATYAGILLRLAVYKRMSGQSGYWQDIKKSLSVSLDLQTFGAIVMVLFPNIAATLTHWAKQHGFIKKFG